jgi:putative ABC transport system permease protein
VTLALGFGAFVVGTVLQVEGSLMDDLTVSFGEGRPNVLLFDVQKDQVDGVRDLLPEHARRSVEITPLITARIAAIDGRTPQEIRADSSVSRDERPERWALRREYRNTYRAELGSAESLVAGRWWDGTPAPEDARAVDAGDLAQVSLEEGIAQDLKVGLGDTISWDVSGETVRSVVTSIRHVDWGRLQPNFFAVFQPGAIDDAPQTIIMVARLPDAEERAAFQRSLVHAFPNVSALDFSRVQQAIDDVLSQVRLAVGFLALFSALAGVVVLVGALAASRLQRTREGALLKTLGARRPQVLTVLFTEYLALGTLATATGLVLAWGAAAILVPHVFHLGFTTHPESLLLIWAVVTGLTLLVGLVGSRGVLGRPPLAVLREVPE